MNLPNCDATRPTAAGEIPTPLDGLVGAMLDRRIRDLRIVIRGGGIVLRGRACSYHAKQLAQHAAMSVTDLPILANEIEVVGLRSGATQASVEDHPPSAGRQKPLVLIATGDDRLQSAARHHLGGHGYGVAIAGGGVECVAFIRKLNPEVDVVILDTELLWGGADGVLAHLRARNATRLPVVLLKSGSIDSREPETAAVPPIVSVLEKPVSPDLLLWAVRTAVAKDGEQV